MLVAVVLALYLRTLSFEFVFDDWAYIVENPLLKRADSFLYPLRFAEFATTGAREGFDSDLCVNFILRPVAYFSLFLNQSCGGLDPAGFRLANILIHAANACLIALLLSRWLTREARQNAGGASSAGFASFSAALLFAVHPMQSESVTYVTQRFESLATFFFLATCLAYDLHLASGRARGLRLSWLPLVAGLLTKEIVITAPLMLVAVDVLIHRAKLAAALWRARLHLAAMAIVPALLAATSWAQNGGSFDARKAANITNLNLDPLTPLEYARTQVCASVSYLRLLLWPAGQNADADYPAVTSWLEPRFLASAALIVMLVVAALVFFVKKGRRHQAAALTLLGTLWFFITLLPSSSFVPLPDLFVEHRSYLPAVGLAFVVAAALASAHRRLAVRSWAPAGLTAAIAGIALLLSVANWRRNEIWRNEVSFWRDAAEKSPRKARPWQSLGTALAAHGNKRGGLDCLEKALALEPRYLPAWVNVVLIHLELGQLEAAERISRAALRLYPETPTLHHNLGMILAQTGRLQEAVRCFQRTLELQPATTEAHVSLAHIYRRIGDHRRAIEHLRAAIDQHPDDATLRALLSAVEKEAGGVYQTDRPAAPRSTTS